MVQKIFLKRSEQNNIPELNFGEPAIRTLDTGRVELIVGDVGSKSQVLIRPFIPTPEIEVYSSDHTLPFNNPMPNWDIHKTVQFHIKIPMLDKVFLEYKPFVELRMLKSKKRKKITSPANYGGCVLGFQNREQGFSIIPQTTQILIPNEFKSTKEDVESMVFEFNPHLFFGNHKNSFTFPILKSEFESRADLGRNRRQIGSNSSYHSQIRYIRTSKGLLRVVNRGKALVVGFRIACLAPGTENRLIYGDDSLFFAIRPELCKQGDSSLDYYYKWTITNAF